MNRSQILSIDPKGNITCYDKEGNLRTDLNSYKLSKLEQFEIFGRIMIMDKKTDVKFITNEQIESDFIKNKELLLNTLIELTNEEFNNLCKISAKSQSKLLKKAYKRTNSLRKVEKLAMKYQLYVPHEENVPTIIPFYFKKVQTNPSVSMQIRARKYLEAYGLVKEVIKNRLSAVEVESCFKEYTFEYFTKNTLR